MADHHVGGLHCAEVEDLAASFVLGALEPAEMASVRAHLAGCPEPHPEFAELGSVVPALFEAVEPVEAPASLKGRILAAAADAQREPVEAVDARRIADARRAADSKRAADPGRAADTQRPTGWVGLLRRPAWAGLAMAAVVAAVAIGIGYVGLRSQVDDLTLYRNAVAAVLEEANKPGAQLAVLRTPDGAFGPGGLAVVAPNGTVTLVMHDLAATEGSQVYEAWLIAGEHAPVPIGGFTVGQTETASFVTGHPSLGPGVTVALTLEARPGATTPTLPIIASGAALTPS